MMTFADLLLLSVALAMDCFTISIVNGVIVQKPKPALILKTSFLFGFFQALMPYIGWMLTNRFAHYIESYDHWVAFGLLAFLGIRMIVGSLHPDGPRQGDPQQWSTQLLQAVATSIDALAVGISMAAMGYASVGVLLVPLAVIGIGSFVLSIVGFLLGIRFGGNIRHRLKPELLGGCILLLIGIKTLLSHLL